MQIKVNVLVHRPRPLQRSTYRLQLPSLVHNHTTATRSLLSDSFHSRLRLLEVDLQIASALKFALMICHFFEANAHALFEVFEVTG